MKMDSSEHAHHHEHAQGAYKLFFGALATDSRWHILNALRHGAMNVSELCRATKYEQSMVSHNLKILEYHGMVFPERRGKFKYYKLNDKTITPLLRLINVHMKKYCNKIMQGTR